MSEFIQPSTQKVYHLFNFLKQLTGNKEHEEDLAVIALNTATVLNKLKIIVTEFEQVPIMRIELVGDAVATFQQVKALENLQHCE